MYLSTSLCLPLLLYAVLKLMRRVTVDISGSFPHAFVSIFATFPFGTKERLIQSA